MVSDLAFEAEAIFEGGHQSGICVLRERALDRDPSACHPGNESVSLFYCN
jgi:hypothetical protein